MSTTEYPLALVVRAVDKATEPIRAITAKINALTAPAKKLGDELGGLGKALNLGGLGSAAVNFGGAVRGVGSEIFALGARLTALGVGAALAFGGIVKTAMDAGDKLGEVADRVGLTVDAYASLSHAAAQADVDQETFSTGMDRLNKNMGDMKVGKGGAFLAFLNEISPTFAKQMKAAKGTEQALALLTDAFAKIDDPARQAIFAAEAFGKSGLQMGRFLHQGSAAIQEQQRRYMELVGSQEAFAKGAGELDNATRETELAFLGLRNVAAGALFPALTKLAGIITAFLTRNRYSLQQWAEGAAASLQGWIDSGGSERLVAAFREVAAAVQTVVTTLGPMGTAIAAGVVVLGPLIASLGSLGVAAFELGAAALPLLTTAATAAWPALAAIGTAIAPFLITVGPFILAITSILMLGKAIADNWGELSYIFKDWGNSLKFAVLDAWKVVEPILSTINDALSIGNIFGATREALGNVHLGAAAAEMFRPSMAPAAAAARPPIVSTPQATEARVSVNFSNLPSGARVSTDASSSQPVDVTSGYAMSMPQ